MASTIDTIGCDDHQTSLSLIGLDDDLPLLPLVLRLDDPTTWHHVSAKSACTFQHRPEIDGIEVSVGHPLEEVGRELERPLPPVWPGQAVSPSAGTSFASRSRRPRPPVYTRAATPRVGWAAPRAMNSRSLLSPEPAITKEPGDRRSPGRSLDAEPPAGQPARARTPPFDVPSICEAGGPLVELEAKPRSVLKYLYSPFSICTNSSSCPSGSTK